MKATSPYLNRPVRTYREYILEEVLKAIASNQTKKDK